ncbi:MAG TPA: hypothetical protein VMK83_10720 [Gaiellaceae bacterium]|nr:hypothetical protein [Gaiellaceae bacterium]
MIVSRDGRTSRTSLRVTVVLVAAVAVLITVSGAWALIGGGTAPATFKVTLDGGLVTTAKGYALDGTLASSKKEYTLRLSLQLTDNAAPAQSFHNGDTFASAKVDLLGADLAVMKSYTLTNATVVAYRQTGDAATNTFTQELVLKSKSLAIG